MSAREALNVILETTVFRWAEVTHQWMDSVERAGLDASGLQEIQRCRRDVEGILDQVFEENARTQSMGMREVEMFHRHIAATLARMETSR